IKIMDKETKRNNETELDEAELDEKAEPLTEEDAPEEATQALTETGDEEEPEDEDNEAEEDGDGDEDYEDEDEDEDAPLAISTKTVIDSDLLDFILKVQLRQAKKSTRRNLLIGVIAAVVAGIGCLMYGQDLAGWILWIAALLMFQSYWNSSERSARKRLQKSEGQVWDYTFAEDGIHVGASLSAPCITWGTVARAWLEDGYYVLEVKNSDVVVKAASLTEQERNAVELLMLEHVTDCRL
ncbi:MAG: hypothetical protein LUH45_02965, partial [Clostridiales bacterium]|nr:hypothetical protein [Clostridiales bacterium]